MSLSLGRLCPQLPHRSWVFHSLILMYCGQAPCLSPSGNLWMALVLHPSGLERVPVMVYVAFCLSRVYLAHSHLLLALLLFSRSLQGSRAGERDPCAPLSSPQDLYKLSIQKISHRALFWNLTTWSPKPRTSQVLSTHEGSTC